MATIFLPSRQDEEIDFGQGRARSLDLAFSPKTDLMLQRLGGETDAAEAGLGSLSSRYETGGRGPGAISSGAGDSGGASYGSYQLASRRGRPQDFLRNEGRAWAPQLEKFAVGTADYNDVWKAIAERDPAGFAQAQHDYIDRTHYRPQIDRIRTATGRDLSGASTALKDVVWSTAVQHGPGTDIIVKAMRAVPQQPGDPAYEPALIHAIYAERGRRRADGKLAYFSNNSPAVQAGVANRFVSEEREALKRQAADTGD
ncbi:MAG TPA: hypothetical protein VFN88_07035 [Caulobacteraceae bacterium]|nr:hypothetical protein [Caulobacteraceae bacterium]